MKKQITRRFKLSEIKGGKLNKTELDILTDMAAILTDIAINESTDKETKMSQAKEAHKLLGKYFGLH